MVPRWSRMLFLLAILLALVVGLRSGASLPLRKAWWRVHPVLGRGFVHQLAWSPAGERLALVGTRGLWLCDAGLSACDLSSYSAGLASVAFSPAGRQLATGTKDGAVVLWNPLTGLRRRRLTGCTGKVRAVAFSPDGTILAAGDEAGGVYLYRKATYGQPMRLEVHNDAVTGLAFSPDGRLLASSSHDGTVQLWDVASGAAGPSLVGKDWGKEIRHVAWSPGGAIIAAGNEEGQVILWDVSTGRRRATLDAHDEESPSRGDRVVLSVDFSPDGGTLAAAGFDGTVHRWRIDDEGVEELGSFLVDPLGVSVPCVRFSPDGHELALSAADGAVYVWPVESESPRAVLDSPTPLVRAMDLSPDGRILAVGSYNGWVRLWKVGDDAPYLSSRAHQGRVYDLTFSPDGRWLATSGAGGTVRLWDVSSGRERTVVQVANEAMCGGALAFARGGTELITIGCQPADDVPNSYHTMINLWRVSSAGELTLLDEWRAVVDYLALSPDGSLLATTSWSSDRVSLWNPHTGQRRGVIGPRGSLLGGRYRLAFSPDGRWLAAGGHDGEVMVWDTQDTFWRGRALRGHSGRVHAVAFSPDGRLLASGGSDMQVRLWEVESGRELEVFEGHEYDVLDLTFTPDGATLLSASYDNTVRAWSIPGAYARGAPRIFTSPLPLTPPVSIKSSWLPEPSLPEGWRRLYPNTRGDLHALAVASDTLYAVGNDTLRHDLTDDERSWQRIASRAGGGAWSVGLFSEDEGWLLRMRGSLIHFRGDVWEEVDLSIEDHLWDIEVVAPDDAWIVGENGAVWHYDGRTWMPVTVPITHTLYAVDFVSEDEAWAVGRDGTLLHFEGEAWRSVASPTDQHLRGLDMASPNVGWAVGVDGTILGYNGQIWQIVASPTDQNLHSVSAPAPDVAWAVGWEGAILHYDGERWTQLSPPLWIEEEVGVSCPQEGDGCVPILENRTLWDVLMLSADEGWMAGEEVLAYYSDGMWRSALAPAVPRVVDFAPGGEGWAMGRGLAMKYTEGKWYVVPETRFRVEALDVVSEQDAWAVGENHIYHYDGTSWKQIASPGRLWDLEMISDDEGWAVGYKGLIVHYDGREWREVTSPTDETILSLSMPSADEGWAVGRDGLMLHYREGAWETVTSPTSEHLRLVAMASPEEGWIVAGDGNDQLLLHYRDGAWQPVGTPTYDDFVALEMVSEKEGWALTDQGEIFRYRQGAWWSFVRLNESVADLAVLPSGEMWVVGSRGAILHYDGDNG